MDAATTPPTIEQLLEHTTRPAVGMQHEHSAKCCCGDPQCAILADNSAALEGLEKDLVSAAQIGQVCLSMECAVRPPRNTDDCDAGSPGAPCNAHGRG